MICSLCTLRRAPRALMRLNRNSLSTEGRECRPLSTSEKESLDRAKIDAMIRQELFIPKFKIYEMSRHYEMIGPEFYETWFYT